MVAEGKMANVFICVLQFGKFLQLCFFLFQPGPRSALAPWRVPKLVKGKAGSGGKRASPSLLSWVQSLPHLARNSLRFTHLLVF